MKRSGGKIRRISLIILSVSLLLGGFFVLQQYRAEKAIATDQNSYRWRNDDGDEASATYAAAENEPITMQKNVAKRLRFGLSNTGSETELEHIATLALDTTEIDAASAVISPDGLFAYFGMNTSPGKVVKIDLLNHTRVGSITLAEGENFLRAAVINPTGSHAWFITDTTPSRVVKIDLATFSRVGAITLAAGENNVLAAAIDPASGDYALLGTNTIPGIVIKVNLASMSREGAVTLGAGENFLRTAVFHPSGSTAYFGTYTNPGRVVGVDFNPFQRTSVGGGVAAFDGADFFASAVIDATGEFAYFGTDSPGGGAIAKFDTAAFAQDSLLTVSNTESQLVTAQIDPVQNVAYFGSDSEPVILHKVDLNPLDFSITSSTVLTLDRLSSSVIDLTRGIIYFGSGDEPASMHSFTHGPGPARPEFIDSVLFSDGERFLTSAAIDEGNGVAYFGSEAHPGKIIKVGLSRLSKLGVIDLAPTEGTIISTLLDLENGFGYFVTDAEPAAIIKVDLSDFTRAATLDLGSSTILSRPAFIDAANGFIYYVTGTSPYRILKIELETFTQVDALALSIEDGVPQVVEFDPEAEMAYVATDLAPPRLIGVDLATFTRTGEISLTAAQGMPLSAVMDGANDALYIGIAGGTQPGRIIRVDTETFTQGPYLSLLSGEKYPNGGVLDPTNGFAYFTIRQSPGKVVKIRVPEMTRSGEISREEGNPLSIVIDRVLSNIYVGAGSDPGKVVKISVAPKFNYSLQYGLKETTCGDIRTWSAVGSATTSDASSGLHDASAGSTASATHALKSGSSLSNTTYNQRYTQQSDEQRLDSGGLTSNGKGTSTSVAWRMSISDNLTDLSPTTNSSGITDGNLFFRSGAVSTSRAATPIIPLGENEFTEFEFSLMPTGDAIAGASYCFRLANPKSLDTTVTYTTYAEARIASAGSSVCNLTPRLTLVDPDGGERFVPGEKVQVLWSFTGCAGSGRISLSTDGGATYPTVIADGINLSGGFHEWTVPDVPYTDTARLKIELVGVGGVSQAADASDGSFIISGSAVPPSDDGEEEPLPEVEIIPGDEPPSAEEEIPVISTEERPICRQGWTIMGSNRAVYYCAGDGHRYLYPRQGVFLSWHEDFSRTLIVSDEMISRIPKGGTVGYRAGMYLVKAGDSIRVYLVDEEGVLHWIVSEELVEERFGSDWRKRVDIVTTDFLLDMPMGDPITSWEDSGNGIESGIDSVDEGLDAE